MKRIPIIVLSVLLAAGIISGVVLYGEYQNTRDALLSKEKKVISLDEKVRKLNQEASLLQNEIHKKTEEKMKELGKTKKRISELENIANVNDRKIVELTGKLRSLEKTYENEKEVKEALMAEVSSKDARISKLFAQLKSADSQIEILKGEIGQGSVKIEELQRRLSKIEKERRAIEGKHAHLMSTHETSISNFRKEIQTRDVRIAELQGQVHVATGQAVFLKEEVAEGLNEIQKLQGQLSYIEKQKMEVVVQLAKLTSTHEATVSELDRQTANWGAMIADLRKRFKDIMSQMPYLQEEVSKERRETKALGRSLSDLENRRDAAQALLERLKSDHQVTVSYLQEEIQLRDAAVVKLAEQCENATSEVLALRENLWKLQTEIEGLQGQLTEVKEQKKAVEAQLAQLKSRHEASVTDLKEEIKAGDMRSAELQGQLRDTRSQVTSLQQEVLEGQNKIEALQQDLLNQREQKAALETQAEQLKSTHEVTVSQLNTEIQGRNATIEGLEKKVEDLTSQILIHKEKLSKRESEIEELQSSISDLLGQKAQLITQIDELKSTHDAMVSDLKSEILNKQVTLQELEEKLSITFVDRILFEFGKADITPKGKVLLRKVGEALASVGAKKIRVVGHTDNKLILPEHRVKFSSNWELSAARAAAVVRYFQNDIGIDPRNMEAVGQSFYRPIASNETEEGRSQNRRVAIIIAPKLE